MPKRSSRRRGYLPRKVNTREIRKRFLIVCEGEKTEPNYFEGFRVPKIIIKVEGVGRNPSQLVRKAAQLNDNDDYDRVWCVFDKDDFLREDFNNAISGATSQGFSVAYSNKSFELWYLLHFEYVNTGISRARYISKLSSWLGHKYEKNSGTMYGKLIDRQHIAIRNAKKLLDQYDSRCPPANNDPSTTVHELVEELNKSAK